MNFDLLSLALLLACIWAFIALSSQVLMAFFYVFVFRTLSVSVSFLLMKSLSLQYLKFEINMVMYYIVLIGLTLAAGATFNLLMSGSVVMKVVILGALAIYILNTCDLSEFFFIDKLPPEIYEKIKGLNVYIEQFVQFIKTFIPTPIK